MRLLNKIKASEKLYLLVVVMSIFIIGIGLYGINEMKKMSQQTHTLYADRILPMEQLTMVRYTYSMGIISSAEQAHAKLISYKTAAKRVAESQKIIADNWNAYRITYMTPEEIIAFKKGTAMINASSEKIENLRSVLEKEDSAALNEIIKHELYPTINPLINQINTLLDIQVKVSENVYQSNKDAYNKGYQKFLFLIILSLLFAIPFSFFLVRNVKDLIKDLRLTNAKISKSQDLLRESEERFSKAFKSAPVSIAVSRISDGTLFEVNGAMERFLKYNRDELIGKTTSELKIWADLEDREFLIKELMAKGYLNNRDFRFRTKEGKVVIANLSAEIIELGGEKCFLSVFIDITERKQMEESLQISEKKYRNIFENVQDVFYQTNFDNGLIIDVSPSVQSHIGYSPNELIGTSAGDLYYNVADRDNVIRLLSNNKELIDYEFRLKSKSGVPVYVSLSASLITSDSENHVDGIIRNITERKKSEELIRESEARLKEAQAIAHLGNWEIDLVNDVHIWSDEFYKIFETTREEVVPSTETLLTFIHPDDVKMVQDAIRETFTTLDNSSYNFRFFRKDKSVGYGYAEWKFEFDKDRQPIRLYGILQDITERKKGEEEREKMAADIIQRNKNFEEFSFIVSHNLRSPVAAILGISEMLNNNPSEQDRAEFERFLLTAVEKLDQIIRVLNEVLQIRTQITESKETIQFSELIRDIKSGIFNLIPNKEVQLHTDFSAVESITTLRSCIQSIFYNLITNSIKFSKPNTETEIWIRTEVDKDKIKIYFKDNGIGIDLQKFGTKIFTLYERFHLNIEGKGIGLFMVKTQIEILGGKISVESKPDEGTEFIIELPI